MMENRRTRTELAEAESSLVVHLQLYDRLGDSEGVADAYRSLGALYEALDDLPQAEAMYEEALALDDAPHRKAAAAASCGGLGRVAMSKGLTAQAETWHRKALGLAAACASKASMAQAYTDLEHVCRARGDLAQAAVMQKSASVLLRQIKRDPLQAVAAPAAPPIHGGSARSRRDRSSPRTRESGA